MTARHLHPAYVAGIIDGEGSIFVRSPRHGRVEAVIPYVSVANSYEPLIESLSLIGGHSQVRDPRGRIGNKPMREWTCSGETAAIVLRACLPYLYEKRGKAEAALAAWAMPRASNSAAFRAKARSAVATSGWLPIGHPAIYEAV